MSIITGTRRRATVVPLNRSAARDMMARRTIELAELADALRAGGFPELAGVALSAAVRLQRAQIHDELLEGLHRGE